MKREPSAGNGRNNRKKNKAGNVITILIIVIAAGVFCFAGYRLFRIWQKYHSSAISYEFIHELVQGKTGENSFAEPESESPDYEPFISEQQSDIKYEYEDEYDEGMVYNYQVLHEMNPDIIGYIKTRGDGSVIDYPIVQDSDNNYYIDHMVDGTYNPAGSIFMDCNAYKRFSLPYCIIYGHNMALGSRMFGYLKQYTKEAYYRTHTEYDIFTPYNHYVYKVFAVYKTDIYSMTYSAPILYNSESMSDEEKAQAVREFASYALSQSDYDSAYKAEDLNEKSHLIALSTCYDRGYDDSRYILLLIRDRIVISR